MSANPVHLFPERGGIREPGTAERGFPPERRKRARTRLHWPITLFRDDSSSVLETVTQNLSSNGFYCVSPVSFMPGERLHCALKLPAHDPAGRSRTLSLECRVRVVRAEPAGEPGFFGIACRIEDFHLVRQ